MGTADDGALVEVHLIGVPLALWQRARDRHQDLLRELALIHQGEEAEQSSVPARLVELTAHLRDRFGGFAQGGTGALEAGAAEGKSHVDVTFTIPRHAGPAAQDFLAVLDETDAWCRDGALLTLAAPDELARFRRWYLTEFSRQVAGEAPIPWQEASVP